MSDKNKESSPPPLLLMGATEGLTLTPATGASLLMPVPQVDSSLMAADEGGEEDSFVGQGPPAAPSTFSYFQSSASSHSDPFAQVGQPLHPPPAMSSAPASSFLPPAPLPAQFEAPGSVLGAPLRADSSANSSRDGTPAPADVAARATPPFGAAPPRGVGGNFHRKAGPPRYVPAPGMGGPSLAGPPANFPPPSAPPMGPGQSFPPPMEPAPFPNQPPRPPASFSGPPSTFGAPPQQFNTSPPSSNFNMPSETSINPPTFGSPPLNNSSSINLASPTGSVPYYPVTYHWFYCKNIELRQLWHPFSVIDSVKLEEAFKQGHQDNVIVSVEGGRYDVDIIERSRSAVYWEETTTKVRRCSWFFKPEGDTRFVPYEEDFAEKLEAEYRSAVESNVWHKRTEFGNGECIVMHNPNVIVHFKSTPDEWGTTQTDGTRPKVVKRGVEEAFETIDEGEPSQCDHVVFVVHGIGSTCDLRFRNITECVDDFRSIAMQMVNSHFEQAQKNGRISRVEFLPVRWHAALHGDATGVDRRLKSITLNSIGKLRHFTNDTLLDILFYASPRYAQKIADTVGQEINRLYQLFLQRHPGFKGQASVAGHSLGALILFDLLSHQRDPSAPPEPEQADPTPEAAPPVVAAPQPVEELNGAAEEEEEENTETLESLLSKLGLQDFTEAFQKEQIDIETLTMCEDSDIKEMGIPMGPRKKLQGFIKDMKMKQDRKQKAAESKLKREAEQKAAEAAAAAQQAAAERRLQESESSSSPTSHNDPLLRAASNQSVSFMSSSTGTGLPFVKYPQLDFTPANFFALGSPIAMFLTVRGVDILGEDFRLPTCQGFYNIFHPFDPCAYRMEPLITPHCPPKPILIPHHKGRKRLHLELKDSIARMGSDLKHRVVESVKYTWKVLNDFAAAHKTAPPEQLADDEVETIVQRMAENERDDDLNSIASSVQEEEIPIGVLNHGRRLDYVLQEKPIESFNDYLFALGSHLCYWESEDTALMILRETYSLLGVSPQKPGAQVPNPLSPQDLPLVGPPKPGPPPVSQGFMPSGGVGPRPKRVVDPSIYGGAEPPFQPGPFSGPQGPPPLTGFVRKS